jgi:hypothetical protein
MTIEDKVMVSSIDTISHSGRQLFYSCPRKFQLSKTKTYYADEKDSTKALSFGKAFGTGLQALVSGKSLDEAFLLSAMDYDPAIAFDADAIATGESLAHVHEAIQSFYYGQLQGISNDWKVLDMPELYGVELGFAIHFPSGAWERGFIDLVLQNKTSGEVIVLEIKTSGNPQVSTEAKWINSPQGIMYLLILDYLLAKRGVALNNRVLYIEYNKKHKQYTIFPFEKTLAERVDFLISIRYDVESRSQLPKTLRWFKSGNCISYNRQCRYFGVCDLNIELEYPMVHITKDLYHIEFNDLMKFYSEKLYGELGTSR